MDPFVRHTGTAVPLRRSDVDTDQIIPSDWLKRVERTGFGAGLFSEWREDPSFVLNRPEYADAGTLCIADEDLHRVGLRHRERHVRHRLQGHRQVRRPAPRCTRRRPRR